MSRSLPLSSDAAPTAPELASTPATTSITGALAGTVQVFDPAMCCPTGICGPGVDPALLQITRDLRWLSAQGAIVQRVGLAQEPQAFVANTRVAGLMQAFGDGALPAVLVNDAVVSHGRYPSRQELIDALSVPPAPTPAPARRALAVQDAGGDCCTPGSGCC